LRPSDAPAVEPSRRGAWPKAQAEDEVVSGRASPAGGFFDGDLYRPVGDGFCLARILSGVEQVELVHGMDYLETCSSRIPVVVLLSNWTLTRPYLALVLSSSK
jgi:hypothetical protein